MPRHVFKKSTLDNGMVLVTESLPRFQSLSIGAWVNAGTRHERKGEEGLSHFLEHMLFKGTEKRSALEIARAIDQAGGEFNAFTSREYTCFHLLTLARDLRLSVDIITDVLLDSTFDEQELERERRVILQEIAMVEDNPEELVHDLFFEQAFGGHALGKPILGSPDTVKSFGRQTVVSYFRRHYSPAHMVLSVAGDVSHEEARRLLNRYLGRRSGSGRHGHAKGQLRRANLHRPSIRFGSRAIARELEQSHIVVGFPGMPYDHVDRFAALLLNVHLGGGMSSSLFQEIREKRGLAYTVYSSLAPFSDTGLLTVYVGTSPKEVKTCLDVVGRELARLREKPLAEKEFRALKDNLKGTILLNSDSVESRMTSIAKNEMFFGKYYSVRDAMGFIERVRPVDLQRLARKLFRGKGMILTLLGPKVSGAGVGRIARFL